MSTTMRALRAVGLLVALAAAVTVFVVGGRDGGTDWQVPALVLIGVLVIILHAATSPWTRSAESRSTQVVADGGATQVPHAMPHHLVDPTPAEVGSARVAGVPSPVQMHAGMPEIVVPAASFPDAGHGHGPVIAVTDDRPPPPLHAVLGSELPGAVPGQPTEPWAPPTGPSFDPLLVDLRPDTAEPMVMRVLPGDPPPEGSRADVVAPSFDPQAQAAPAPPPPPPPNGG